jgi:hypothetical protein
MTSSSSSGGPLESRFLMAGESASNVLSITTSGPVSSSASQIAQRAADLVGGERDRQHGKKLENFQNIADLWTAYLGDRKISALDVGLMMALMKVARTKSGAHNLDDFVDGAGYLACAGEIAEQIR